MFCPNCGVKNEDNAVFCGSCGARLQELDTATDEQVVQEQAVEQGVVQEEAQQVQYGQPMQDNVQQGMYMDQPPKEKKPFKINKYMVTTAVLSVTCIASVVAFFLVGKNTYSTKTVATDYFKAVQNADWETAYEMMDIEESEFINKELFGESMSGTAANQVGKFSVKVFDDEISSNAVISYRKKGSSDTENINLAMNKQSEKNFLFFDSWKVSSTEFVANNFTVRVPKGATLYLDGKAVEEKYVKDENDEMKEYVIPKIFKGTHSLSIEIGEFKSNEETYNLSYNEEYYTIYSVVLDEKTQKDIIETAYSYVLKLTDAAVTGQKFTTVEELFTDDVRKDASKRYDSNFASSFYAYSKEDGITSVELKDVEADLTSYYITDGQIVASVNISADNVNKGVKEDWWTGELKEGSDEGSVSMSVSLVYEDGKWLINDKYSIPVEISYNAWF